ncbi:MAG TPA: SpoIIE family protein phosphatase [Spirochaetota bacterium]|nr:SpoIIE family protein phosphatase [Spirochaetota bacterium]
MYTVNLIATFISTILVLFTAFFVFYKNRTIKSQAWNFFFMYNFIGAGIPASIFMTYYMHDSPDMIIYSRLSQIFSILFSSSVLNLSLTYPERQKKVPLYIPILVSLPAVIISILIFSTDLSIKSIKFVDWKQVRETGNLYPIYALTSFSYFIISWIIFLINYIRTKIETYRLQIRYVFLATSIFITLTYIGSIFMPLLANNFTFYALAPSSVSLVSTFTLFYSVIAYNIMDIRTAIHKTTMYIVLSTTVFIPIFIITYFTEKFSGIITFPHEIIAGSSVMAFVLFVYLFQPGIDRAFKRKIADIEGLTNRYIKKASRLKTLEELIKASAEELHQGLGLTRALFFIYDEETRGFKKNFDTSDSPEEAESVDRHSPLIIWFARNQEILPLNRVYTDDQSFKPIRNEVTDFFNRYDISAILPLYYENRIYGMLCLGKKENMKSLTPDELDKLEEFRIRSNDFIITALAYDKAKQDQFISRSLGLSGSILHGSSADSLPQMQNMKFGSLIAPGYSRGVDYFDFLQPTKNTIGILFTDVSGLGINNALYSVLLRSVFHSCINEAASPYIIIKRINLVLHDYTKGKGELVTAFYAFFDTDTKRLFYSNAGFPPAEVFRIDRNDFDSLDTEGSPLGYKLNAEFGAGRTELKSGDICVIYSKSFINSKNSDNESFGLLRLRNIVKESKSKLPVDIAKNLKSAYENFMGIALQGSDITLLIIKIT